MTRDVHAVPAYEVVNWAIWPDADPRHPTKPAPPVLAHPAKVATRTAPDPILQWLTHDWQTVPQLGAQAGLGGHAVGRRLGLLRIAGVVERALVARSGRGRKRAQWRLR